MREIKFRAWDGKKFHHYTSLSGLYGVLNPIECQYTGLKDKNGKEIYEGDIATHPDHKGARQIVFNPFAGWMSNFMDGTSPERIEVIGNIYENPELLTPTL